MAIFLHGLALQNYRGIGPKIQRMPGFKDFNIFIGANNAGKSTILSFISKYLPLKKKAHETPLLDRHLGSSSGQVRVEFGLPIEKLYEICLEKRPVVRTYSNYLAKILQSLSEDGYVWAGCNDPFSTEFETAISAKTIYSQNPLTEHEWYDIWSNLTNYRGGSLLVHWIPETLHDLAKISHTDIPETILIPAIRQIGAKGSDFDDFSGKGLIDQLARLQNPGLDKYGDQQKDFEQINAFLQDVTGSSTARIQIPHDREHALVHMDGKILPLSSLGTGIEEVILIAAACTISKNQIVCMEEPELHLHPLLQRKLLQYLRKYKTDNQYFIATHSPTFIDTPDAAIFHVSLEDGQTVVRNATLKREKQQICADLGHKASELLQANAVIWVEGPSDRIYLQHWLSTTAPELIEGTHYSIMFYGGRLLSHLSASDDEVTDFINLRALNRNIAIAIDSDRKSANDNINATKQRIVNEFKEDGGVVWVTAGREIENYVKHVTLQNAVAQVHRATYLAPANNGGRYDHALYFKKVSEQDDAFTGNKRSVVEKTVDKVKVAHTVCAQNADLTVLDLQDRIQELVDFIRNANGLPPLKSAPAIPTSLRAV